MWMRFRRRQQRERAAQAEEEAPEKATMIYQCLRIMPSFPAPLWPPGREPRDELGPYRGFRRGRGRERPDPTGYGEPTSPDRGGGGGPPSRRSHAGPGPRRLRRRAVERGSPTRPRWLTALDTVRCVTSQFSVLLRQLRRQTTLTQEELAERSGLSVRTVRRLETGERANPPRGTGRAA